MSVLKIGKDVYFENALSKQKSAILGKGVWGILFHRRWFAKVERSGAFVKQMVLER